MASIIHLSARRIKLDYSSRFLGIRSSIPWWRRIGQAVLTALTNTASGVRVTDSQSGYRAFSPAALDVLAFGSGGLGVESEMQFLLHESGLRVVEVPIHVHYLDKAKRSPVRHGLQVIDMVLALVARRRPLLFFTVPGMVLAIAGVALGAAVVEAIDRSHLLPVGTALLTTMLLLGGALLGVAGVILHSMDHLTNRMEERLARIVERMNARMAGERSALAGGNDSEQKRGDGHHPAHNRLWRDRTEAALSPLALDGIFVDWLPAARTPVC